MPLARVIASEAEFIKLLAVLDDSDRLVLRPASESERHLRVGLQCTYKDERRDRLILDARPPNAHELQLKRFVRHMANASILLEIVLADDEFLASYLDDIRDMYYVFEVSDERAARNTFALALQGSEVPACVSRRGVRFDSPGSRPNNDGYRDTNACEIAQ